MQNYKFEKEVKKKRADWDKSIKDAKVRIGLQCHRRRRKVTVGWHACSKVDQSNRQSLKTTILGTVEPLNLVTGTSCMVSHHRRLYFNIHCLQKLIF